MAAKSSTTTEVEIFGATYNVRGNSDSEYLQEVARLVDRKMREIARHVATGDATKIAILAALNLADELCNNKKRQEGERVEIEEKVAVLAGELGKAVQC
jgi:cell division protein ZapA